MTPDDVRALAVRLADNSTYGSKLDPAKQLNADASVMVTVLAEMLHQAGTYSRMLCACPERCSCWRPQLTDLLGPWGEQSGLEERTWRAK